MDRIIKLVEQNDLRCEALECVQTLNLPQCYIAAGFVRNLVWDHLHGKTEATPLNDVDVIYFDAAETGSEICSALEAKLTLLMPQLNWQVRNQAIMHLRNGDAPYLSSADAMRYWPEKETAVAIRQSGSDGYECISAFGFECLFALTVTHNPKRTREMFEHRVKSKGWLDQWPLLSVISSHTGELR